MGSIERRQREKEQRREQILDTARKLLFKKGIDATSMNQIARNAELSVGTLYLYFKNKESLFAALQEEGLDLLYTKIKKESEQGTTPGKSLREWRTGIWISVRNTVSTLTSVKLFSCFAGDCISFLPEIQSLTNTSNRILSVVEDILKEGVSKGTDEREIRRKAVVFCSSLYGMMQFKKLRNTVLQGENFRDLYMYSFDCIVGSCLFETEDN